MSPCEAVLTASRKGQVILHSLQIHKVFPHKAGDTSICRTVRQLWPLLRCFQLCALGRKVVHTGPLGLVLPHTGGGIPGLYLRALKRGGRRCSHSGLQALLLLTIDSSIIRIRWNAHGHYSSSTHGPLEPYACTFKAFATPCFRSDDVVARRGHAEHTVLLCLLPALKHSSLSCRTYIPHVYAHGRPRTDPDAQAVLS